MPARDNTDIAAGALLLFGGLGAAIYCAINYDLGQLNYMGPGMFPTGAGVAMAVFGALIAGPAFFRTGKRPELNLRAAAAVLAGVALFAAAAPVFGLVAGTVGLVLVCALGDTKLGIVQAVVLAALLSTMAWLIFRIGLGITLPAFRWPF